MTSFLRTRKDRHPKHDKPRLPQEHGQNIERQASNDSRTSQVDSSSQEEPNRTAAATRKEHGRS